MGKLLKNRNEIELALDIETNYIFAGKELNYEDLAQEYGVSVGLLQRIAATRKWEDKIQKLHKLVQEQAFIYSVMNSFPDLAYTNAQLSTTERVIETIETNVKNALQAEELKPRDLESLSRALRCAYDLKMDIIDQKQDLVEKTKARISQLQDNEVKDLNPEDIIVKLQAYLETRALRQQNE